MDRVVLLDAAGRRRSAARMPGHRRGLPPRQGGMRYPEDPPSVEEIELVMRHAGDRAHGLRLRGLIVVMWRAGLRISEALALTEDTLQITRVEAGRLWLGERGPLKVPKRATDSARIGWEVWVVMAHHRGRWHLLQNGLVYP